MKAAAVWFLAGMLLGAAAGRMGAEERASAAAAEWEEVLAAEAAAWVEAAGKEME